MSERSELALKLHASGCNCCQAVLLAMDESKAVAGETGMRFGACFGGGMGVGEMCGAVSGALMVLGLRHGPDKPEEQDKKKEARKIGSRFIAAFAERYGSYQCKELIKINGKRICDDVISGAVEMLESREN